MPAAALADPRLEPRAKLVLAAIASFASPDGTTESIAKSEIASACGLSATNLAREFRKLVAAGWLDLTHQPGANSCYRLRQPQKSAPAPRVDAGPAVQPDGPSAAAPADGVRAAIGVVANMSFYGNCWLVRFALPDESTVSTIFHGAERPCDMGDTAKIVVRESGGRKNIAGGSAAGVEWLQRRAPKVVSVQSIEVVVSQLVRYATPAGRIFVALAGEGDSVQARGNLPVTVVPTSIGIGTRIRISRRDGAPLSRAETCGARQRLSLGDDPPPFDPDKVDLELAGDAYLIEPAGVREASYSRPSASYEQH